mgnify:CR=1 FL=1
MKRKKRSTRNQTTKDADLYRARQEIKYNEKGRHPYKRDRCIHYDEDDYGSWFNQPSK